MILLTRQLKSFALVTFFLVIHISTIHSRHHGIRHHRHKRQHGANLYLPDSFIILNGEGDPSEWGDWGSPSECSRTCGGGVAFQTRECHNVDAEGRPRCRGGDKKYFSCNTQDCPDDEVDFREQQCSQFDDYPFEGMRYTWVPYTRAPNPCELNCMPRGERFYFRHKSKVTDGTRCNAESLDVCVDGQCQKVGCDMMLGSTAVEDKCRQCAGDGTSCKTVSGLLDMNDMQVGYNDVLLIPAGATNIGIREVAPSNNYLAIRNLSSHYYLNGNWRIDFPRPLNFAGAFWHYERKPQGFAAPDHLTCIGATTEAVYVVLLYQDRNVGINYEYSVPEGTRLPEPDTYTWSYTPFTACTKTCGGGIQTRNVTCNSRVRLELADDSLCDAGVKQSDVQQCGQDPCPPKWNETPWSKCTEVCGTNGTQEREVTCERVDGNGKSTKVADAICIEQAGNKPATVQECNKNVVCPQWYTGPWVPCSKLCGEGVQTRQVKCYRKNIGNIELLPEEDCPGDKPEESKECLVRPCEGVDWITSSWSGCDACGQNKETRTAYCGSQKGKIYDDSLCDESKKPELMQDCKETKPCKYQWYSSQWTTCSAECGKGVQTRNVVCADFDGITMTASKTGSECDAKLKPEASKDCESEKVCPGQWFAGPWADCSVPCGGGTKTRKVLCISNGTAVDVKQCSVEDILLSSDSCNPTSCSEDEVIPVTVGSRGGFLDSEEDDDYDDECSGEESEEWTDEPDELGSATSDVTVIEYGASDTTESSFTSDDVMMSDSASPEWDSTASTDLPKSTVDGSGDETDGSGDSSSATTIDSSDVTEGSGSESTDADSSLSSLSQTSDTDAKETGATESTVAGGTSDTSESSDSVTDTSGSSDATEVTSSGASESSTESDSSSDASGSTDSSVSISAGTTVASSEDGSSVESSTSSDADGSTDAPATTESSDQTSPSQTSDSSDSTSDSTTPTDITETSTDESTTNESSTDESTTDASSTKEDESSTTVAGSSESSESSTEKSTESSTDVSGSVTDESTDKSVTGASTEIDASGATSDSSSDEATESTVDVSTVSGIDETTVSGIDETTVSGIDETTVSGIDETTVSGMEETTVSGLEETTVSGDDKTTSSGVDETTVSGPTETTVSSVTDASVSTDDSTATTESAGSDQTTETDVEGTTIDIWSTSDSDASEVTDDGFATTPNTLAAAITKEQKPRKSCKKARTKKPKEPKVDCTPTEFGCCPDQKTVAKGPFAEGCPTPETCKETKYGCCPDGVSAAEGKKNKGCPEPICKQTLFGCCPDDITVAESPDFEGCPPEATTIGGCAGSKYGCCADGVSEAKGKRNKGCPKTTTVKPPTKPTKPVLQSRISEGEITIAPPAGSENQCAQSTYGCCPDKITEATGENQHGCAGVTPDCHQSANGCCDDNKTPATGPNKEGCGGCDTDVYGCCRDGVTPAHGPNLEGCCISSPYGCCPDNVNDARGPNLEDCGCEYSPYGCCPDNKTSARGPANEGCDCRLTENGCCPDQITPAEGPDYQGCACHTFQFGCCSDGVTVTKGPHGYGCHCTQSEHKCCGDGVTAAQGPNMEGCTCATSKYGCCQDGVTEAQGSNFEGCATVPQSSQKACNLPRDAGTCSNYTVKSFFDVEYGSCSRFWYGGCGGNDNRFESVDECKEVCQEPEGKKVCQLPKIQGPCTGYYPMYYYDSDRGTCSQFIYGGCLGNNNRFESREECQKLCAVDDSLPACEQPVEEGPCNGTFDRWYFDKESDICRSFTFGGCKANKNNFATEGACNYQCKTPGKQQASCKLEKVEGECSEKKARWHFSEKDNKCMPFYFTGCGGNKNNYFSLEECEDSCPKHIEKDLCYEAAEIGGCTNYTARWYFDTKESRCRQFYWGGCGGNGNNFEDEDSCVKRCDRPEPEPEPDRPAPQPSWETSEHKPEEPQQPQQPEVDDRVAHCFLGAEPGRCREYLPKWYYNSYEGTCAQFVYGGCDGNANQFETVDECEESCGNAQDACVLPPLPGGCDENITKWYYEERVDRCLQFIYTGCSGNKNNFYTEQDCENACRREHEPEQTPDQYVPPIDQRFGEDEVCQQLEDAGPCDDWVLQYAYNSTSQQCYAFYYGGCDGNGNRFISESECESTCIKQHPAEPEVVHEPDISSKEICSLEPIPGECRAGSGGYSDRRWYYDDSRGTCVLFIYSGCGGNQNNFKDFDYCMDFCSEAHPEPDHDSHPADDCQVEYEKCNQIHCPYGVSRNYDDNNCEVCSCEDPCDSYACPPESKCVVDYRPEIDEPTFVATCRQNVKPGECPVLSNATVCGYECHTDADCHGDKKCCTAGCSTSCVPPAEDITVAPPVHHGHEEHQPRAPVLKPVPKSDVDVAVHEGGLATLRCFAAGYPPPTIQWKRGGLIINTNRGRYVLNSDGDLQIVQVHQTDSGVYVCVADNGIGAPVQREVELNVNEPKDVDAYIAGEQNTTQIVTLGRPASIQCAAGGIPQVHVSWWRGKNLLPYSGPRFSVEKDYSLSFNRVDLSDLGVYLCEAYSGYGKPSSKQVTLMTHGPVEPTNEDDRNYLQFVIDPVPDPYAPRPRPPAPEIVPVTSQIHYPSGRDFVPGGDIVLKCEVSGYPTPRVVWFKDDQVLEASDRVQISNSHELVITKVSADDSGFYKCDARNKYSDAHHVVEINIDRTLVPADCVDNQFFANCNLIVKGHYCTHKYYAKFCCRSCTLAGQLWNRPNQV